MRFKMSSAVCFNLDQPKILSSGNGVNTMSIPVIARALATHLHYGSFPFTSVVGSEGTPS